jgi:2-polyprenyl-3-methyl-5-hydroxy-6-metoxy-1,4-benzoquinol methylase
VAERYVPAAGRPAFTRLYDPAVALTMREATFRGRLGAQVLDELAPGAAVVDVGCGTGTLAIALAAGGAEVIGVDGDPEVLALAHAKPGAEAVQWRKGELLSARGPRPGSAGRRRRRPPRPRRATESAP